MSDGPSTRQDKQGARLLIWAVLVVLFVGALLALPMVLVGGPLLLHARPHKATTKVQTPE